MPQRIVLAFDIASSTVIIEDLQQTGRTIRFRELIEPINQFLRANASAYRYSIHKFVGDGFILLFAEGQTIDNVLIFSIALVNKCADHVARFKQRYLQTRRVERLGITIGIDKGEVFPFRLNGAEECYGRPINVACRLQSSLVKPEHVNKVLLSQLCFSEIARKNLRDTCSETSRTLKNINNNNEVTCYEFDPVYFRRLDIEGTRPSVKSQIQKNASGIAGYMEEFKDIYKVATDSTSRIAAESAVRKKKPSPH